ncbi:MAG: MFS transporter [Candidatus Lokiarchaeota archaeon]|nr:MFS transporter [Candidatus Lokiarchaeota archaeon]MBD3343418.1 MFS transporter [Candidatus Lokiarchaeota archaeon]
MNETEKGKTRYPKKIIASFQLGSLISLMLNQVFTQQIQYYYQTEVGLDITLFTIAMVLYTIFNMFNDPILGYLCDKSRRLTKRWGKRFPFIVMGAIPWCFMVIFIFSAPSIAEVGQFGVFVWLLIFICIYDGFFSLFDINRVALLPDKFREEKERKLSGMFQTILETLGIMLGIVVPILILEFVSGGVGWTLQAVIMASITFVFILLMIPGIKEPPDLKERRSKLDVDAVNFFHGMKQALRDKNFIGYLSLYVAYSTTMGLMIASIPFIVDDILELSKIGEIVIIAYIIAVPITAPFWYKLSYKIGIKKVTLIGGVVLASMGLPILFMPSGPEGLTWIILILFTAGLVDGAIITMTMPIFSSVVDDATIRTGSRKEGLYNGVFLFFQRVGIAIRSIVFWIVQIGFGYNPGGPNSELGLFGLRLQVALFPMIIMITGVSLFWMLYSLTSEKLEENAIKLKELDL